TREEFGRLDVLVNNAAFQWGRAEPAGLAGIDSARLHRTLTTNLEALFWITQEAAQHLGEGASVINCSSIQSYDPSVPLMDYAATKAAINNVTVRSEEHTSELQSRFDLVCRLLLEQKKSRRHGR